MFFLKIYLVLYQFFSIFIGVMLKDIIQNFLDNGIDLPNFGLYLFKGGRKGISDFKVETIINTIKENNWEEIHFFEDRQDWLNKAEQEVVNFSPKIKFHKHLVVSDK